MFMRHDPIRPAMEIDFWKNWCNNIRKLKGINDVTAAWSAWLRIVDAHVLQTRHKVKHMHGTLHWLTGKNRFWTCIIPYLSLPGVLMTPALRKRPIQIWYVEVETKFYAVICSRYCVIEKILPASYHSPHYQVFCSCRQGWAVRCHILWFHDWPGTQSQLAGYLQTISEQMWLVVEIHQW